VYRECSPAAAPGEPLRLESVDVLVACEAEWQPEEADFPGIRIVRAPLHDAQPTSEEVATARVAASEVVSAVRAGSSPRSAPATECKSTLSQHFKVLREAGLIHSERRRVEMQNSSRCAEIERRFSGLIPAILAAHAAQQKTASRPAHVPRVLLPTSFAAST
jgi:DNA-binding transcriptional ArsR family regulator